MKNILSLLLLLIISVLTINAQNGLIIQEESPGVCTMDGTVDSSLNALGFTGKGYANIDNGIGVGMSWSFSVPADGMYKMTWRYALGGTDTTSRDGKLLVNNDFLGDTIKFPHTDSLYWINYVPTDTITLNLKAGLNKVHLVAITIKGLPNIDYFHILGSNIEPAECIPSYIFTLASNDTSFGKVNYSPAKEFYSDGEEITVSATAKTGYFFHSWSGEASDTINPFTFKISRNTNMTGLFYPNGTVPDDEIYGYATVQHDNGTPYIMTGGATGDTVDANTLFELVKYLGSDKPYVVRLSKFVKGSSVAEINVKSNKTFIGTNDTAHLEGIKVSLAGARNVIIRNITFSKVLGDDLMELNAGTKNVWIDHCEFYTDRDHDNNEDYYDGMLDIKNESSFITVSWCYFHDHNKGILVSSGDQSTQDSVQRMTFHHNYFFNCNARLPSIRFGKAHIYNNYYEQCNTAINTRMNACVNVEFNYFKNAGTGIGMLYSALPGAVDLGENVYINTSYSSSPVCVLDPPYDYEASINNTEDLPQLIISNIRHYAGASSLGNNSYDFRFSVFPNPADSKIMISFYSETSANITIFDIYGSEVFKTGKINNSGFNNELSIDISELNSGIYILQLKSEEGFITERIIVK